MNIVSRISTRPRAAVYLVMAVSFVAGCASSGRMATTTERQELQAALQQYAEASRLSGAVEMEKDIKIKDGRVNIGYQMYEPRVQLNALQMHAKMVKTEQGWQVLSNSADPTLHDLSAWPMVPYKK